VCVRVRVRVLSPGNCLLVVTLFHGRSLLPSLLPPFLLSFFLPSFHRTRWCRCCCQIAYENGRVIHRVVSMDGQIIEKNGTMSGGGARAALGGGMKAHVYNPQAEKDLQSAVAALQAANETVGRLRAETADLGRQRREHVKQMDKLQTMLEKLQIERQALPGQAAELEKRHAALQVRF
jgi:hypothetical protein